MFQTIRRFMCKLSSVTFNSGGIDCIDALNICINFKFYISDMLVKLHPDICLQTRWDSG